MDCKICQSNEPTLNTHEMFSFFSNDDDGDDDIADYENKRGDGGVLNKWIYPQVRAPLLITLRSTSVHLLRKAGGNILYDIYLIYCLEDYEVFI